MDLIERQAAIAELFKAHGIGEAHRRILSIAAVDAVPVRRGRWIIYVVSPFDGEDVKCSECGERGCASYWDYCPHCGADMREEDSDDT